MASRTAYAIVAGLVFLCGCSAVIVEPYDSKKYSDGIRFYRPQPYILVSQTRDDKGNVTGNSISVVYLPDPTQEYVIRERAWIGSVSMKPTLTDGWNLVGLDTTVDTKIPEMLNALLGAAKLGVAPGARQIPGKDVEAPIAAGLYKIVMPTTAGALPVLMGPVEFPRPR